MNTQRERNIEQQHRNTVRDVTETLLRILAPHDIDEWIGSNYKDMLEYAMKVLEQERADVAKNISTE